MAGCLFQLLIFDMHSMHDTYGYGGPLINLSKCADTEMTYSNTSRRSVINCSLTVFSVFGLSFRISNVLCAKLTINDIKTDFIWNFNSAMCVYKELAIYCSVQQTLVK